MTAKKNNSPKRVLKILVQHQPRARHKYIIVPEIRLNGKWLEATGFKVGKKVEVNIFSNKLVITLKDP